MDGLLLELVQVCTAGSTLPLVSFSEVRGGPTMDPEVFMKKCRQVTQVLHKWENIATGVTDRKIPLLFIVPFYYCTTLACNWLTKLDKSSAIITLGHSNSLICSVWYLAVWMITEYTRTESREATFYMEVLINAVFMILNSPVKKLCLLHLTSGWNMS